MSVSSGSMPRPHNGHLLFALILAAMPVAAFNISSLGTPYAFLTSNPLTFPGTLGTHRRKADVSMSLPEYGYLYATRGLHAQRVALMAKGSCEAHSPILAVPL